MLRCPHWLPEPCVVQRGCLTVHSSSYTSTFRVQIGIIIGLFLRRTALWEKCMPPLPEEGRTGLVLRGIWRRLLCVREESRCFLRRWWCCCCWSLWPVASGKGAGAERRGGGWWGGSRAPGSRPYYRPVCSSRSPLCSEALHKTAQNAASDRGPLDTWQTCKQHTCWNRLKSSVVMYIQLIWEQQLEEKQLPFGNPAPTLFK